MLLLSLGASFLFTLVQASAPPAAPVGAASPSQAVPTAKTGDLSTPNDPKERLELGKKVNGLRGLDPLPWHVKASYEVFDIEGKSKDKGTFEEWRISPKQYKLTFHSSELSLEEYGTDHGVFRSGGQDWPSSPAGNVQQLIVQPIVVPATVAKDGFKNLERAFGTVKLQCTTVLGSQVKAPVENAASYCFASTNGILLYSSGPMTEFQTLFQHISTVQDQYVAREIQEFLVGKPWLTIHVDTVESLNQEQSPDLTVPASALPVSRRADGWGVLKPGSLVKRSFPEYPATAKAQGVQGEVMLSASIATDGHVKRVEVLTGPWLLQNPAMDAVRQWVYSPFLMDGEPVEAEINVKVEFRLGR
jgi:TonB family protein